MTGRSPHSGAPAAPFRGRRSARLGPAIVLAAVLGSALAGAAVAASPPPAPSPAPAIQEGLEVWLDRAIPPESAAGSKVAIGMAIWNVQQHDFLEVTGGYVRLHPATGSARPTEAATKSDWPGHLLAEIVVPSGGPGQIEAGFHARACTADGSCADTIAPFVFGGVGPPPEAPRSLLVVATVHEPRGPLVAGEPIDLIVDVEPQAAWEPDALGLPDRLIAIGSPPRGPDLATAELRSLPSEPMTYSGQITIPASGNVTLVVAIPGNGREDEVIPTSTTRLVIAPGADVRESAAPGPAAAPVSGDAVPWGLIGGGLAPRPSRAS